MTYASHPVAAASPGQTRINDVCEPTGGMCVNYCGCPEGTRLREDGTCRPKDGCPEGTVPIGDGVCRPPQSGCPEGTVPIGDGVCRPPSGCRKAPARAVTANASARVRRLLVNGKCCTREIFRPTDAAARKARRRIGTVHTNRPAWRPLVRPRLPIPQPPTYYSAGPVRPVVSRRQATQLRRKLPAARGAPAAK